MLTEAQMAALQDGIKARREGQPMLVNPYLTKSDPSLQSEWLRGWQEEDAWMRILEYAGDPVITVQLQAEIALKRSVA